MSILDEPGSDPVEEQELETQMRAEPEETEPVESEAVVEEVEETEPEPVPTVPLQALNEARHQNRELKQKYSELESKVREMEALKAQVDEWRKAQQNQQAQQEFSTDPLGVIQKDIQGLKKQQDEVQQRATQREQEAQQRQALERAVTSQVKEFSERTPDYPDALNYMMENRARELQIMGASPDDIAAQLEIESTQIAQAALRSGMNPAEVVYNLAQTRGYAPKKPEKVQEKDKIVTLERGQKAAASLPRGSAEEMSFKDIERMSDEEFDKYWDKEVAGKK